MGVLGLEQITDYLGKFRAEAVQRNFDKIDAAAVDLGGSSLGIRGGTGTVTFTASTTSSTVTIPHGLGRKAVSIDLTPITAASIGVTVKPGTVTDSGFDAQAFCATAVTGSLTFYWIAIG